MGQASGERPDIVVIGGGIIGLATALAVTRRAPNASVTVLEKERTLGAHQTGHNSGVVHSGIYYRPGSAKAKLAVKGHASMTRFCLEQGISYERCGKLIVAVTAEETERLAALERRAEANGVACRRLARGEMAELEPNVTGLAALEVPGTAIVDYGQVCQRMAALLAEANATVHLERPCLHLTERAGRVTLETNAGVISASAVVNCAGLWSDLVARSHVRGGREVVIVPFRGEYYDIVPAKAGLVTRLIYPVPDPLFPFLGVHVTRGVHGGLHAGPNAVLALARAGYRWRDVNLKDTAGLMTFPGMWRLAARHWEQGGREVYRSLSRHAFGEAVRRMVPAINDQDLVRAAAGVRAQAVSRQGELLDDFVIRKSGTVVHVLNAPSPGATASLEIGEALAAMVRPLVA